MPRTHAAVVGQNAEHEKTREETSSKHPHKKGAAQAAEGRIRELKSSNATVSPAAAAANNSATATAARQRDNQRALDEKRKERSRKRKGGRSITQASVPRPKKATVRFQKGGMVEKRVRP